MNFYEGIDNLNEQFHMGVENAENLFYNKMFISRHLP